VPSRHYSRDVPLTARKAHVLGSVLDHSNTSLDDVDVHFTMDTRHDAATRIEKICVC
jgi:hypothetical protein